MAHHQPNTFDWTPEILARLGVESDNSIARELGCSRANVIYKRQQLNIKAARTPCAPYKFPERHSRLLGTASDEDVAKQLKLTVRTVRKARLKRGIAAFMPQTNNQSAEILEGMPSEFVKRGRQFGLSDKNIRRLHDVGGFSRKHWPDEVIAKLGKVTDGEIARRLGVTSQLVQSKRKKMGIPRFGGTKTKDAIEARKIRSIRSKRLRARFSGKSLRIMVERQFPGHGGLTRFARAVGITTSTLNYYLTKNIPYESRARKMAEILRVDLAAGGVHAAEP